MTKLLDTALLTAIADTIVLSNKVCDHYRVSHLHRGWSRERLWLGAWIAVAVPLAFGFTPVEWDMNVGPEFSRASGVWALFTTSMSDIIVR